MRKIWNVFWFYMWIIAANFVSSKKWWCVCERDALCLSPFIISTTKFLWIYAIRVFVGINLNVAVCRTTGEITSGVLCFFRTVEVSKGMHPISKATALITINFKLASLRLISHFMMGADGGGVCQTNWASFILVHILWILHVLLVPKFPNVWSL